MYDGEMRIMGFHSKNCCCFHTLTGNRSPVESATKWQTTLIVIVLQYMHVCIACDHSGLSFLYTFPQFPRFVLSCIGRRPRPLKSKYKLFQILICQAPNITIKTPLRLPQIKYAALFVTLIYSVIITEI